CYPPRTSEIPGCVCSTGTRDSPESGPTLRGSSPRWDANGRLNPGFDSPKIRVSVPDPWRCLVNSRSIVAFRSYSQPEPRLARDEIENKNVRCVMNRSITSLQPL